jgi:beta-glucosidase
VEPAVFRPFQELKGFSKVFLAKGERQPVVFELTVEDFSYFDVSGSQWKADPGQYIIRLGSSSRDIRASLPVDLRL